MFKKFILRFKIKKTHDCECQHHQQCLNDVPTGTSMRIDCIEGDESTCHRLREMGFCESSVVEKIAQSGSLICKVCDSKVIISKNLAKNIMVKDVCQMKDHKGNELFLSQLKVGQKGILDDFAIDSEDGERLLEMGLTPGEEIEVVRFAPLGDPIEIKIRGYNLSLRRQEADQIKVKLI